MLRHPTSIALTAIVNSVTADGCVHITESVGSRRELVANSCIHRRRRRDATRQFRRVGVGDVYWALLSVQNEATKRTVVSASDYRINNNEVIVTSLLVFCLNNRLLCKQLLLFYSFDVNEGCDICYR